MIANPVLALDLDGVVCNWADGAVRACHKAGIIPYDVEPNLNKWDWWEDHMTREEWEDLMETVADDPFFWEELKPYHAELQVARELAEAYDTYIVTARPYGSRFNSVLKNTMAWVKMYFGPFAPQVVRVERDEKADVIRAIGATHFVDDHPQHVYNVLQGTTAKGFLLNRPWNEGYIEHRHRYQPSIRLKRLEYLTQILS